MSIHEFSPVFEDKIFISSHKVSQDLEILEQNGITHILSILPQAKEVYPEKFKYKIIKHIEDEKDDDNSEKIRKILPESNEFIQSCLTDGGKILVHCKAGKSRSVTLVVAYLMVLTNYGYQQIINTVQKRRWCAQPNFRFAQVLRSFYENIEKEAARIGVTENQSIAARYGL